MPRSFRLRCRLFGTLWNGFADRSLLIGTGVSLRRLLLGYGISLVIGVPLGVLLARQKWADETIGLLVLGLQTLPSVCWLPLALLWFRFERCCDFVCCDYGGVAYDYLCCARRGAKRTACLSPCRADDGNKAVFALHGSPIACRLTFAFERCETRLVVCVAFADGGANCCSLVSAWVIR